MKTPVLMIAALMSASSFAGLPADLAAIVEKLDSECAGNDNGYVGEFDVESFSAAKVMRELKKGERGASDGSCKSIYSASMEEGVAATLSVLFGENGESSCVNDNLSRSEQRKLRAMIEDPTNLGVFSKEWDGESGDSEYCMYANYDIYRADGTVVSIVFNHTD